MSLSSISSKLPKDVQAKYRLAWSHMKGITEDNIESKKWTAVKWILPPQRHTKKRILNRSITLLLNVSRGRNILFHEIQGISGGWHSLYFLILNSLWSQVPTNSSFSPNRLYTLLQLHRDPFIIQHTEKLCCVYPIYKTLQGQGQEPAQNSPHWWSLSWPPSQGGSRTSLIVPCFPLAWSLSSCIWVAPWNTFLSG